MSFLNYTPREMIMKTKLDMNTKYPFYCYIAMNMRISENAQIPTMGVSENGDMVYNPKFVVDLVTKNKEYLIGVVCHEVLHVAMLTFSRRGMRDHMLWNMATDLAINWLLIQDNLTLPEGCLLADHSGNFSFTGKGNKKVTINISKMCSEEIYDQLEKHSEKVYEGYGVGKGNGKSKPGGGDGDGEGQYKGQFDQHMSTKGQTKAQQNKNAEKWRQVTADATAKAKSRGTLPAHLERILGELLDPEVDWREKLRHYVTKDLPSNMTYRIPSKKYFATGIYYPSIIRESINVLAAIDVSGSISDKDYNKFMSELMGIVKGFDQLSLRVIFWATSVDPEDDILIRKGEEDRVLTYKPKNSGGTHMSCANEYIKDKNYRPSVVVYLTDGCVESNPELYQSSLVVVTSNGNIDEFKDKGIDVTKLSHETNRD